MSEKKYYWLKLQNDFFSSLRIKKLRKLAGGDTFTIIYLKMQLKCLVNGGYWYYKGIESSLEEEVALDIDEDVENVKITIQYLLQCGLMEETETDCYKIPYVETNVGAETASAQRGRNFRKNMTDEQKDAERERARIGMKKTRKNKKNECYERVTNVEIEIEKEIEIDKDINIYSVAKEEIFSYLNQKTGKKYKGSKQDIGYINARLKDGYTVDDFKRVIDNKCATWLKDERMKQYLRPSTLFAPSHFDEYLNERGNSNGDSRNSTEELVADENLTEEQREYLRMCNM